MPVAEAEDEVEHTEISEEGWEPFTEVRPFLEFMAESDGLPVVFRVKRGYTLKRIEDFRRKVAPPVAVWQTMFFHVLMNIGNQYQTLKQLKKKSRQ